MREKGPWHHTGCGRTRRNFMVDYSLTDKTRGCCSEVRLCSGMVARTCKEVANGRTRLHWVSEARDSHTMTNENVDKIYVCQCFEHRSALCKEAGFQETYQNKHWSDVSPVAWSWCPNKRKISASFANWTLGGTSTPRNQSAIHFRCFPSRLNHFWVMLRSLTWDTRMQLAFENSPARKEMDAELSGHNYDCEKALYLSALDTYELLYCRLCWSFWKSC